MRFVALLLGCLLLAIPALADMYPDASNAKQPGALNNIGKAAGSFFAPAYGSCIWDATHDVGGCINLASAAAITAGGGRVVLPAGTFGLSVTVDVPGNNCIQGAGSASHGTNPNVATNTGTGTVLKWIGSAGGRMASSISTSGQVMQPCMNDITFDGNAGLAADGLHAASVYRFNFDRLAFIGGFNGGKVLYIGSDAAAAGSSQDGTFNYLNIDNGGGWTSDQLVLAAYIDAGGTKGNASFLSADNIIIGGGAPTTGIKCVGCDNTFIRGRVFNSNVSIDYTIAQSGANMFGANGNHYEGQYSGPAYFRGQTSFATCTSYVTCAHNNEIIIDQTNNTPAPTIETGAVGNHWKSNSGYSYGYSFIGKDGIQPAAWFAENLSIWGACETAAKANDTQGVIYLCNSVIGTSLIDFDDLNGDRFRIGFVGSNGSANLTFKAPLAGTGKWDFADTLQLDTGTIGKGTHQTAAFNSASFGQFLATDEDYANSSRGTLILQYGSAAAGTMLGINKASLGVLEATNSSGLVVATNNAQRVHFGTNGGLRAAFESNADHFLIGAGPAPAPTSCGTSPAISGDDQAGEVTMGTGSPIGCVITFSVAYVSAPYCVVTWQATPLASQSYVVANDKITLTQTATNSNKVNYMCRGRVGG